MSPRQTTIPQVATASVSIQGVDLAQALTGLTSQVSTTPVGTSASTLEEKITRLERANQSLSRQNSFLSEEVSKMKLEISEVKTNVKRKNKNMGEHLEQLKALIPAAVKKRKTEDKFRPSADLLTKADVSNIHILYIHDQ